jgi:adenine phosphoribosyltransferase
MSTEYKIVEIEPNYFTLDPAGETAKRIAGAIRWYSAGFSPKPVPRFYDAGSLTENPAVFKLVIDVLVNRYSSMPPDHRPTHIVGYDARGFLLGTPVALGLGIPFVMLRKDSKSPGVLVKSSSYTKEYKEAHDDTMVLRVDSLKPESRVVLIDDLIATGGTAITGFELCKVLKTRVVEFCAVINIPGLDGVKKIHEYHDGHYKGVSVFTLIHDSMVDDKSCGDPFNWPQGKSRLVAADEAIDVRTTLLRGPLSPMQKPAMGDAAISGIEGAADITPKKN